MHERQEQTLSVWILVVLQLTARLILGFGVFLLGFVIFVRYGLGPCVSWTACPLAEPPLTVLNDNTFCEKYGICRGDVLFLAKHPVDWDSCGVGGESDRFIGAYHQPNNNPLEPQYRLAMFPLENDQKEKEIIGVAVASIPLIGRLVLIFVEKSEVFQFVATVAAAFFFIDLIFQAGWWALPQAYKFAVLQYQEVRILQFRYAFAWLYTKALVGFVCRDVTIGGLSILLALPLCARATVEMVFGNIMDHMLEQWTRMPLYLLLGGAIVCAIGRSVRRSLHRFIADVRTAVFPFPRDTEVHCPICSDLFKDPIICPSCNMHVFCRSCLMKCLKPTLTLPCPLCRRATPCLRFHLRNADTYLSMASYIKSGRWDRE